MALTQKLLKQLERYLANNYIDPSKARISARRVCKKVSDIIEELDETLEEQTPFSRFLFSLIAQKGLSEVEVYKKAHIDRRLFSKIRTKNDYTPSKNTVLRLVIAMELSFDEAKDLLDYAGYSLSRLRKEDMIVKFFLEKKSYDFFLINEALTHYGFPTLG